MWQYLEDVNYIIKAARSGNIFGGYTEATWNDDLNVKTDNKAFIFSLINKENKPVKVNVSKGKEKYAVVGHKDYWQVFGSGTSNNIVICDNSNSSDKNYSNFGYCYDALSEYPYGSEEAKSFLAGSFNFKVDEIEVFRRLSIWDLLSIDQIFF